MTTWSAVSRAVSAWATSARNMLKSFLLKEDGGYLLLEGGGRIILRDDSWSAEPRASSSWNQVTRH